MMDNAGDNDALVEALASILPDFNPRWQRLRCIGHIINLIVKAFLFGKGVSRMQKDLAGASDDNAFQIWGKMGPIGKAHNICVYINRNDQRREAFRSCITGAYGEEDQLFNLQLIVDRGIRWNAVYAMIKRVLHLRNAIELYQNRWEKPSEANARDLSADFLTKEDFNTLELFCKLLKKFHDLTIDMEGNANRAGFEGSYGAVWEVIRSMQYMFNFLAKASKKINSNPSAFPKHYKSGIDCAYLKLIKYYALTDDTPIYRAAVVLHPAFKMDYFEEQWKGNDNKPWLRRCKKDIGEFFACYEERYTTRSASPSAGEEVAPTKLRVLHDRRRPDASSSDDEDFAHHGRIEPSKRANKRQKLRSELDRWCDSCPTEEEVLIVNPLEWWRNSKSVYPILYQMAMDLFSIPAMSSECERKFSSADDDITDDRNRLADNTIESLQLQKDWLQKGIVGDPPEVRGSSISTTFTPAFTPES